METKDVISALAALAQESRLAVFRLLVQIGPGGLPVGRIGETLGIAPATLSFHVKELTRAGLVATQQQGRHIYCSADFGTMNAVLGYLTENCCRGEVACTTGHPRCTPDKEKP